MCAARVIQAATLSLLPFFLCTPAGAQSGAGSYLGFNVDFDHPMVGLQGRIDLSELGSPVRIVVVPSAETFFTLGFGELYQFDLNLLIPLPRPYPQFAPYAGAGAGITRGESPFKDRIENRDHESFNLLLGAQLEFGQRVIPFAQVRISLVEGDDHTSIKAGAYLRW